MNKEAMDEMKKKGKKVDKVQSKVVEAAASVEDEEAMIAKAIAESQAQYEKEQEIESMQQQQMQAERERDEMKMKQLAE